MNNKKKRLNRFKTIIAVIIFSMTITCGVRGDDEKNIVRDNIIEIKENEKNAIKRKYKDDFIKIGGKKKSIIEIIENDKLAIKAHESYIFVGYKVNDIFFIKSRSEFIYKPNRFLLAIEKDKLKLFYTGTDGKIRDVSAYAENKFKRYNIHFEGFNDRNIYIISVRELNKFEMKSLKDVNSVLAYIKLKN